LTSRSNNSNKSNKTVYKILFKKQLFDLEVKGQGPMKVIVLRDTPPYGHAYTNYLSMNSFVGFIGIIIP
jgi:hypothetical protein